MIKVYCDICKEFIDEWNPNQQGYSSANQHNYFTLDKLNSTEKYNFEFIETWRNRKWCLKCVYEVLKGHFDYQSI